MLKHFYNHDSSERAPSKRFLLLLENLIFVLLKNPLLCVLWPYLSHFSVFGKIWLLNPLKIGKIWLSPHQLDSVIEHYEETISRDHH